MKPLYITAVVTFSGKTALLLGIGLKLQEMGKKVGYFKPVSTQPYLSDGKTVDEDADFVRRMLGLEAPASALSGVIIDDKLFNEIVTSGMSRSIMAQQFNTTGVSGDETTTRDYMTEIKTAMNNLGSDKDVLLVEGTASMREGYAVGASSTALVEQLKMPTLGVIRYRNPVMLIDDVLSMKIRLRDGLLGVVINSVPEDAIELVRQKAVPYLERNGIKVYGVLPSNPALMSLTVGELTQTLDAKTLTTGDKSDRLVESLTVGAMSAEAALPFFRRMQNKAVITGGDRADIQAAALETSTVALVLTGNLQPSSTIIKRAEEAGVTVLLVPDGTLETVEAVERVFGKTRLAHPEKLNRFREMMNTGIDYERLFQDAAL